MKAAILFLAVAFPVSVIFAVQQQLTYESKVLNIEIPVRVFEGDRFVDDLAIGDFEVLDNGVPQRLEAFYLIKKASIKRREEISKFSPFTDRYFYLIFEMNEYDPKINKALTYFINEILMPGDNLILVTPLKTYRLRADMSLLSDKRKIVRDLIGHLRKDIVGGSSEYRDVLEEMKSLVRSLSGGLSSDEGNVDFESFMVSGGRSIEERLQTYVYLLTRLENIRSLDAANLRDFARYLENQAGQKEVFLFYQREFVPKLHQNVLQALMNQYNDRPDILLNLSSIFDSYKRDTPLDVDFIKESFANASAAVHFLFVTKPAETTPGLVMEEQSEDIYAPFREMSRATGGLSVSSANVEYGMKAAMDASENYYLLYYIPQNYVTDGSFHKIEVRVKRKGCRVSHRSGYIAD